MVESEDENTCADRLTMCPRIRRLETLEFKAITPAPSCDRGDACVQPLLTNRELQDLQRASPTCVFYPEGKNPGNRRLLRLHAGHEAQPSGENEGCEQSEENCHVLEGAAKLLAEIGL